MQTCARPQLLTAGFSASPDEVQLHVVADFLGSQNEQMVSCYIWW